MLDMMLSLEIAFQDTDGEINRVKLSLEEAKALREQLDDFLGNANGLQIHTIPTTQGNIRSRIQPCDKYDSIIGNDNEKYSK